MKKTVLWHEGVKTMVSKRNVDDSIKAVANYGILMAEKKDFILLGRRVNYSNWKAAVTKVFPKNNTAIIESLRVGEPVELTKADLRRIARLRA